MTTAAAAAVSAAAGLVPPVDEARLEEELRSLGAVVSGMRAALKTFTGEARYSAGADPAALPTIPTVSELITLAMAVLQRDASQARLRRLLSREEGPGVVEALVSYIVAGLTHAPGEHTEEGTKKAICGLRVLVLRSLAQLVTLTCYDDVPGESRAAGLLRETCADVMHAEFEAHGIPGILVGIAAGARHVPEDIKVAAAECMFIYTLRNAQGRAELVGNGQAMRQLLRILTEERSPMVRNYVAACLRECAQTNAGEVERAGLVGSAAQIVLRDGSTDVRVLVLETLEVIFTGNPDCDVDPQLAETAVSVLGHKDTAPEVLDKACRIVDAVVELEARKCGRALAATPGLPLAQQPCEFTTRFVAASGVEALLRLVLHARDPRIVAPAARAFRRAVQHAPWRIGVGRRVANGALNDVVGLLLAAAASASPPAGREGAAAEADAFRLVALVELSLGVSLIFAQSADVRGQLVHSLGCTPEWAVEARTAILACLDKASPEYFADMAIIDAKSGQTLNVLDGVEWDDQGWPTNASIFQALNGVLATGPIPPSMQYSMPEVQAMRLSRFTQLLLRFSVHLAFCDDAPPSSLPAAAAQPPAPRATESQPAVSPPPPTWSAVGATSLPRRQPPRNTRRSASPQLQQRSLSQPPPPPPQAAAPAASMVPPEGFRTPMQGSPPQHSYYADPTPVMRSSKHRSSSLSKAPIGFAPPKSMRRSSSSAGPSTVPPKFFAHDDALKFVVRFARRFSSVVKSDDSHTRRSIRAVSWAQPKAANPWRAPPQQDGVDSKCMWTVDDLKPGDLCIFTIPYDDLCVRAVETARLAAHRHTEAAKKGFLTTPQRAKGRRWCLYDLNKVMPHLQYLLVKLAGALHAMGEKEARVALFMLREKEIRAGEVGVSPGNLPDVVEQLQYYHQVHAPAADESAEIVAKMHRLAREDPEGFQDLSSTESS